MLYLKEKLIESIIHSIIIMIISLCVTYLIIVIPIVDIVSFTKIGSKTSNARVMGNKNLMSKLIVYGKSLKNSNIIPTKGLGDFLFYTILLSSIYKVSNDSNFVLYGACLIFLGCAINWIIVCFIYNKKWYKGFPATFIPLISVLPLFLTM